MVNGDITELRNVVSGVLFTCLNMLMTKAMLSSTSFILSFSSSVTM